MRPRTEIVEMPPQPVPSRAQQLRLFFMAGLTGAVEYKNRRQVEEFAPQEAWPALFEDFFMQFDKDFKRRVVREREDEPEKFMARTLFPPDLWRINSDAVLFTELMFPIDDQRNAGFRTSVRTFVELVTEYDKKYESEGISVRGCVWTAGFPLRNKRVQIVQSDIAIMDMGAVRPKPADPAPRDDIRLVTPTDFIGRDMDLGFRLAAEGPPGRVIASLDAGHFLKSLPPDLDNELGLWHVGWLQLPDVFGGVTYPRLLMATKGKSRKRHPWDDTEGFATPDVIGFAREELEPLEPDEFNDLFTRMRDLYPALIVAYASGRDRPFVHEDRFTARDTTSLNPIGDTPEFVADPSSVETITLDDLNQILLALQENEEILSDLRSVLLGIAEHPTYRAWEDKHQFAETLYRLDRDLAFQTDAQRRLLEALGLVKDDILRVKINRRGSQAFLTDGFWVPASIRVFPDADESDLLIQRCGETDLDCWATTVLDAATGCGHSVLRYRGDARRFGFDRSARAIAYASINTLVNNVSAATIAINDIGNGFPLVFSPYEAERVLVLVNMPFALVANPNTLARTSDGGRHGYGMTLKALDAIDRLATQLPASCEVRAVVLAYSIGHEERESWIIRDLAMERFTDGHVKWKLLPNEKLWRVNGVKDEMNPMPLDRLWRKSQCRFHVRREKDRATVRSDYEGLTEELRGLGHEHLGYGVLDIALPGRAS